MLWYASKCFATIYVWVGDETTFVGWYMSFVGVLGWYMFCVVSRGLGDGFKVDACVGPFGAWGGGGRSIMEIMSIMKSLCDWVGKIGNVVGILGQWGLYVGFTSVKRGILRSTWN